MYLYQSLVLGSLEDGVFQRASNQVRQYGDEVNSHDDFGLMRLGRLQPKSIQSFGRIYNDTPRINIHLKNDLGYIRNQRIWLSAPLHHKEILRSL